MFNRPDNQTAALLQTLREKTSEFCTVEDPWSDLRADPDLAEAWDMGPPSEPPSLTGKSKTASIELMVEWFKTNFEDRANRTPVDEGEYVYIWGGPYCARERLEEAFGSVASEELIKAAAAEIGTDYEWAPAGWRMEPEPPSSDFVAAKRRLMRVLGDTDVGASAARFDVHAVVLVLRELNRLQRQRDSVRLALDSDSFPNHR